MFSFRTVSYSLILMALIKTQITTARPNTCADYYNTPTTKYALWLENPSEARDKWVRKQSGATIRMLKKSKNYQTVSDAVLSFNSKPYSLSSDSNSKAQYDLRFMGINKPQTLYRTSIKSASKEVILDTETLTKDTSFSLLQAVATKKDSHVLLIGSDNGNTDVFQLYVYDLSSKQVVRHLQISGEQITWKNEKEFFFIDAAMRAARSGHWLQTYNVETGKTAPVKKSEVTFIDTTTFTTIENGHSHLHIQGAEKLFLPRTYFNSDLNINSAFTVKNQDSQETFVFAKDYNESTGKVLKATQTKGKTRWEILYKTEKDSVIESVQFNEDHIVVNLFWGPSVYTKIIDYNGKLIFEVPTPGCCSLSQIEFTQDLDIATVHLSSHFKSRISTKYSIKEKRFLDPTIEKQMMSFDGIDYTSAIHWAISEDGTKIPTRLTYRKDLPRNSNNPVLIYAYGGFGLPGYMGSFNSKMDAFFMKNGGIVAGPAVRGGNEMGKEWHESATHENKFKTFEDLAAIAKMTHALKLSRREKTIIQGWSNGGMVVAATGLLYSDLIGYVVSGNGVNDLLRKEILDPEFDNGWSYEYGDSRIDRVKAYLMKWSPVYRAQQTTKTPGMLIANGRLDSRVDSAHSMKLADAMKAASSTPENVHLLSINNSGHWMTSIAYQNTIAWKSQTLIWTYIFDKMGMTAAF